MADASSPAPRFDETRAVFFDGATSRRREVTVRLGDTLEISEGGAILARWPYASLRQLDGAAGSLRLRSAAAPELARLELDEAAFIARLEERGRAIGASAYAAGGGVGRIVLLSIVAAASIILTAVFGVPLVAGALTPLVPASAERFIGDAVENQVKAVFGAKTCSSKDADAAFSKMVAALERQGNLSTQRPPSVLESHIPNAFALPGGKVFVLSSLLDKAENPDELAGVLAHELGHVAHRDGMRMLIQTGGTSFLIGLLFGDITGSGAVIFAARALLDATYSRDAEFAADGFAIDVMRGLGRSPKPMGEFLLRVTGKQGDTPFDIFASHPFSEDRLARMTAADKGTSAPPLLDDTEWKALKDICK